MKAQVTIYVILGIVIVATLAGVFILKDYVLKSQFERESEKFNIGDDFVPIYNSYQNCVDLNSCGTEKNKPSGTKSCNQECVGESCNIVKNEETLDENTKKNKILNGCSEWSECKPQYTGSNFLTEGLNVESVQTRTCNFDNVGKLEFKPCNIIVPITLE